MTRNNNPRKKSSRNKTLEEALLAEEQEIENAPDVPPSKRDIRAYDGFGSEGVQPTVIDGENYQNLE